MGPLSDVLEKNKPLQNALVTPMIVKAAGGGGGRGMRVVRSEAELEDAI